MKNCTQRYFLWIPFLMTGASAPAGEGLSGGNGLARGSKTAGASIQQSVLALILLWAMFTGGCAATSASSPAEPPQLTEVKKAFEQIVAEVYSRQDQVWHHGSLGNLAIYWGGDNQHGWCHEWQEVVYAGITPTLRTLGWTADRINVGVGTPKEHHAVLIYDPKQWDRHAISNTPKKVEAYVLDAWLQGQASIFTLKDWLNLRYIGGAQFTFEEAKKPVEKEHAAAQVLRPRSYIGGNKD